MLGKVDTSLLGPVVSFILGGGLIGGYATFRKLKPESDRLVVDSAEIVLRMTSTALEQAVARHGEEVTELRAEMKEMRATQAQTDRTAAVALAECNAERRELRRERDDERANNWELRSRIEVLEAEVAALRSASGPHPVAPPEGSPT